MGGVATGVVSVEEGWEMDLGATSVFLDFGHVIYLILVSLE